MGIFLETACPSLGVILSNVLFIAPAPAVIRAERSRQLGGLNPTPLALMVLASVSWCGYGLAVPNAYIVASNLPGLVISVWYIVTVLPLMGQDPGALRSMKRLLVGGAFFVSTEWAGTRFLADENDRAGIMGGCATVVCIFMFASPLSTIAEVLRLRSSSSIYGPLTMAQVVNCALWSAYGVALGDLWVWGPNFIGLGLGLLQTGLMAVFPGQGSIVASESETEVILDDVVHQVGRFKAKAAA
mmetsp:Transcript_6073/g.18097  ORF Transcript_6073/g.18097 Transcript_6073/m.18097 type:complete len:243 (+) Transcript_6073:40-768(+)